MFAMYAIKNEDEDRLFIERSNQIRRTKPSEIMLYLGIKDKFIIGGAGAVAELQKSRLFASPLEFSKQSSSAYSTNQRFSVAPFN